MKKILLSLMGVIMFGSTVYATTYMRVRTTYGQTFRCDVEKVTDVDFVETNVTVETSDSTVSGKIGDYYFVDLGLPSGTKWATCNMGAKSPTDFGSYYAWGETKARSPYTGDVSCWYGSKYDDLKSQGVVDNLDNINLKYDAASVNWGETWRMPTFDEMKELIDICTWEWTTVNKVNGYNVVGPNGKSIFLPAAGLKLGTETRDAGTNGYYWSATAHDFNLRAYNFDFNKETFDWYYTPCYYGHTIRPVSD